MHFNKIYIALIHLAPFDRKQNIFIDFFSSLNKSTQEVMTWNLYFHGVVDIFFFIFNYLYYASIKIYRASNARKIDGI